MKVDKNAIKPNVTQEIPSSISNFIKLLLNFYFVHLAAQGKKFVLNSNLI